MVDQAFDMASHKIKTPAFSYQAKSAYGELVSMCKKNCSAAYLIAINQIKVDSLSYF